MAYMSDITSQVSWENVSVADITDAWAWQRDLANYVKLQRL